MSTIFTKIINREVPGHFIYEDDLCISILDIAPTVEGQAMVILKREVGYLVDATDEEYAHLLKIAKKIVTALDTVLGAERTCMVVEGFEVQHAHIKLYPFKTIEGVSLATTINNQKEGDPEALAVLAEKIKAAL